MADTDGYTKLEDFRYERKYTNDLLDYAQVEQILKLHPAGFSEIFYERYINNVYFDTSRFDFYYDNVDGKKERVKYRIRWYGDLFGKIEKPILELKIKDSNVGIKKSYFLKEFEFTKDFDLKDFIEIMKNSDLPEQVLLSIQNLQPALINRYRRKYFINYSREFRITIDKEIAFFDALKWNTSSRYSVLDEQNIVIELKYDKELNDKASEISNHLPFRLTKNSKYVTGVEKFNYLID